MAEAAEVAPTLLVVEDDELLRERLVRAFVDRGFLAQIHAESACKRAENDWGGAS